MTSGLCVTREIILCSQIKYQIEMEICRNETRILETVKKWFIGNFFYKIR